MNCISEQQCKVDVTLAKAKHLRKDTYKQKNCIPNIEVQILAKRKGGDSRKNEMSVREIETHKNIIKLEGKSKV